MIDEFSQLWSRLEGIERAIMALIDIQQRQLTSAASPLTNELRSQLAEIKTSLAELPARSDSPPEIKVGQIKVVEPNGTLRMSISNQDRAPNGVINGKELPERQGGNSAGIIFYNNEGDECGGLIYGSGELPEGSVPPGMLPKGTIANGLSLTFDRYKQDQMVAFQHEDAGPFCNSRLIFSDRPTLPLDEWVERYRPIFDMPEGEGKAAAMAKMQANGHLSANRIYIGKTNGNASIDLSDAKSQVRIRLFTEADGRAGLEFLDETGNVTDRWPTQDL